MAWMSCGLSSVSGPRSRVLSARAAMICCLALAVFASPPVLSAHVARMSIPEIAAASPNIVVATVGARVSRWNELHTLIVTDYTLLVEERLRGEAPDRVSITVPGGTLGTVADDTCISVHLEPGARYLLFLEDLAHPTFTPVTGAEQGTFREVLREVSGTPETFVAAGSGSRLLALKGKPVTFRDFTGAVRSLAAKIRLAPRPPLPAAAGLPAKIWRPNVPSAAAAGGSVPPLVAPEAAVAPPVDESLGIETVEGAATAPPPVAAKFLIVGPAKPPIVVNPLTDSPFSPWDQYQMAYWNRYGKNLFRVAATPTATWAYHNGVSDIAGFPDDNVMTQQFGKNWITMGSGVLAVTFTHREDNVLVEADVVFNPHQSWTVDDLEATTYTGKAYGFKEAVLHELGHVWGLWHPWDDGARVTWDSAMNYKDRAYYVAELFADDTRAVRSAFPPGVSLRDGVISSYVTIWDDLAPYPDYRTAFPTTSSVRPGGGFGLAGPIKIENTGTVPLANPQVEVYLAPARFSFDGAVLIKRAKVHGRIPPGGTLQFQLSGFKVPRGTPAGTYYLAYFLRDPKDVYQGNNGAWSRDTATVTVE